MVPGGLVTSGGDIRWTSGYPSWGNQRAILRFGICPVVHPGIDARLESSNECKFSG